MLVVVIVCSSLGAVLLLVGVVMVVTRKRRQNVRLRTFRDMSGTQLLMNNPLYQHDFEPMHMSNPLASRSSSTFAERSLAMTSFDDTTFV